MSAAPIRRPFRNKLIVGFIFEKEKMRFMLLKRTKVYLNVVYEVTRFVTFDLQCGQNAPETPEKNKLVN